ncbi:MAG: ureidoglycolate lyase [Deltaproteobacteria bacterium]|nr:ureidoglycolate lyase [Deltaproteobacteria bacterium]
MRTLAAQPLDRTEYAPYGDVIEATEEWRAANQGTARKSERLAPLVDRRAGRARPNVSVFRCSPRPLPVQVALLEKHPASTQVFVPMNARRYLVVVSLGDEAPDLSTMRAFVASGTQAITYRPGVWHHPMIALDAETDFVSLVFEDGTELDCVEAPLDAGSRVVVTA